MTNILPVSGNGENNRVKHEKCLRVSPPTRKAPHPGKPRYSLLIFSPVKNRQVDHLAVEGQGKAGGLPGVEAQVGAQANRGTVEVQKVQLDIY